MVQENRLKGFFKSLREIQKREEDDYDRAKRLFNEYIDLMIDGVKTLSREELIELLKEMKWEL